MREEKNRIREIRVKFFVCENEFKHSLAAISSLELDCILGLDLVTHCSKDLNLLELNILVITIGEFKMSRK